jgi:hypothetical protein
MFALIILFSLPCIQLFYQTNDSAFNAEFSKIMATMPEYKEPNDSAFNATIRKKVEKLPEYREVVNLHTWGIHIYIDRNTGSNIVGAGIVTFEENAYPSIPGYYIKYNKQLKKIVAVKKAENHKIGNDSFNWKNC